MKQIRQLILKFTQPLNSKMKSNIILVPYLEVPVSCVQCHQSVVPTLEIPRSPACDATNMHIVS